MTSASQLHLSKTLTQDSDIQPDWVDQETQAEIAAQVASEFSDELDDSDPYGMLSFEDQVEIEFDTDDEAEVKKELAKRGGGWFDGVVDVFLKLEDEYPDQDVDLEKGKAGTPADDDAKTDAQKRDIATRAASRTQDEPLKDDEIEEPPEQIGVWGDIKWFGRVIARTVRS